MSPSVLRATSSTPLDDEPELPSAAGRSPSSSGPRANTLAEMSAVFTDSVTALDWIHRKQLWMHEFASFTNYARERWQITRQRLYQIIKCKSVIDVSFAHGRTHRRLGESQRREIC